MFAHMLGGKLHCIHYLRFQAPWCAPLKYLLQAMHTWQVLFTERPQVIHVQNPPFVCGLIVYLYCQITSAKFVLDHHSAAFGQMWNWALPLQKYLARRAVTNIVTNHHWVNIVVQSWGASALIMGDPFLPLPPGKPFRVSSNFNIVFISTFAPDEPLDAVLEAARRLPQVHIYITGNANRQPRTFFDTLPVNVTCTGFLPDSHYVGLLRAVDAVMVLTTRNHTLQLGGCEAVSVGQPLITSDWPFLREFFSKGAIHVDNTPEAISAGIQAVRQKHRWLKVEMHAFRDTAVQTWNAQLAQLGILVHQAISNLQ
jgi:glycosyltransferase involved in cell wall biosynthesis